MELRGTALEQCIMLLDTGNVEDDMNMNIDSRGIPVRSMLWKRCIQSSGGKQKKKLSTRECREDDCLGTWVRGRGPGPPRPASTARSRYGCPLTTSPKLLIQNKSNAQNISFISVLL